MPVSVSGSHSSVPEEETITYEDTATPLTVFLCVRAHAGENLHCADSPHSASAQSRIRIRCGCRGFADGGHGESEGVSPTAPNTMIYFTADTHFGHTNILRYCSRPWTDVRTMDDVLIRNINERVKEDDVLYHLGDFAFGSFERVQEYRSRIRCKNVTLVYGNHDKCNRTNYEQSGLFARCADYLYLPNLYGNETDFVLCHYAFRTWNKSHHGSYHVYGHTHGNLPNYRRSMDVGVDCNNYAPISIVDVIHKLKNQPTSEHHPSCSQGSA